MKKIIFDGAYGIKSFGDDAPLIVMAKFLRKKLGEIDAVVVNRHPEEGAYDDYGIRSIAGVEYESKEESIGKWFRGLNVDDEHDDLCALFSEVESSDLLVLGAGNFLVDYTIDILKGPVPRFLLMSLMAQMAGVPIFWYGISVGPLTTKMGRDMARLAARFASCITVRDEKSVGELRDLGIMSKIHQLPDVVYGFDCPPAGHALKFSAYREAHSKGRKVIAISLRALPGGIGLSTDDYMRLMAQLCDGLVEKYGVNILFVPQCIYTHGNSIEDDRNIAKVVMALTIRKDHLFSVNEDMDAYDCLSLYEGAFAAVCTRLHGCVFSVKNGVPTIGLNYNPKVSEFFRWIECDHFVLDILGLNVLEIMEKLNLSLKSHGEIIHAAKKINNIGRLTVADYVENAIEVMK